MKQIACHQTRGVGTRITTLCPVSGGARVFMYNSLKCELCCRCFVPPLPWRDALWHSLNGLCRVRWPPCLCTQSTCSHAGHSLLAVAGTSHTGLMHPRVCSVSCRLYRKRRGYRNGQAGRDRKMHVKIVACLASYITQQGRIMMKK